MNDKNFFPPLNSYHEYNDGKSDIVFFGRLNLSTLPCLNLKQVVVIEIPQF